MIKRLKRRYHYHMAMIYSGIHKVMCRKFYYHEAKHRELRGK